MKTFDRVVPVEITHLEVTPLVGTSFSSICLGHDVNVDKLFLGEFGKLAQLNPATPHLDGECRYPIGTVTSLYSPWKPSDLLTTIRDMGMRGGCIFGLVNVLHALAVTHNEDWWDVFTPLVALGTSVDDGIGMRVFPTLVRKGGKVSIGKVHDSALPGFKNFLLRSLQDPAIKMARVAA